MARSPTKDGGSSEVEATTLNFPKKTAWEELQAGKQQQRNRAGKANGTFSQLVTRLVKDEHMDRAAASIVLKLDAIEDDGDLHTTMHHLLDGCAKLGILKRAMISDALELFDDHKIGASVRKAKSAVKDKAADKDDAKAEGGPQGENVRKFPPPSGVAAE